MSTAVGTALGQCASQALQTASAGASSFTIPYTAAAAAYSTVIANIALGVLNNVTNNVTAITDTQGNAWSVAVPTARVSNSHQGAQLLGNLLHPVTTNDYITLTLDGPVTRFAAVGDNYAGWAQLMQSVSNTGTSATASASLGTYNTPLTCCAGFVIPGGQTLTFGNSYTAQSLATTPTPTPIKSVYSGYRFYPGTSSVRNVSGNLNSSAGWVALLAGYVFRSGKRYIYDGSNWVPAVVTDNNANALPHSVYDGSKFVIGA